MAITQVEQDNIALVRRGFEAFESHDMAALSELFDADATWHGAPAGVLTGTYTGRDAVFGMFGLIGTETDGSFHSVPSEFAASGDTVFVRAIATGTRKGRKLDGREVLVFTLRGGKVRDIEFFVYDHDANVAFWS